MRKSLLTAWIIMTNHLLRQFFFGLFMVFMMPSESSAQRGSTFSILHTFKKGIGISYFSTPDATAISARIGFHAGFAPMISLGENLYLKPEIAFSMKGGKAKYDPNDQEVFDGDITYKINYLELPVLFGYKIRNFFQVAGGVYGAVTVGASFDFDGQFLSDYQAFDKNEINHYDCGLVGGIKIGPLGIRYYYGFTKIAATDLSVAFLGNSSQHTIQVYLQRHKFGRRFNN